MRRTKIISTIIIFSAIAVNIFATDYLVHIYTPRGTEVDDCWLRDEYPSSYLDHLDDECATDYPNATQIVLSGNVYSSSRKFNSHGYVFHMIEAGNLTQPAWMGLDENHVQDYWQDDSYGSVDSQYASIAVYSYLVHSAIMTNQSDEYISKWEDGPLVSHNSNYVRSDFGEPIMFLRKNPATPSDFATLSAAVNDAIPGQKVHADPGVPSLIDNIVINTGVGLIIHSGTAIDLNTHFIRANGGTITKYYSASISKSIYVTGGTNKGYYSTLTQAIQYAGSGQTIEYNETETLLSDITVPSGVTLDIGPNANLTLNGHTIIRGSGTITIDDDATISPDIRLKTGTAIEKLYLNLPSVFADATSGQTIELNSSYTLQDDRTVPAGVTFKLEKNADITLDNNTFTKGSGTISIDDNANLNPDIRLVNGSIINGLYTTIASAYSAGSVVEIRGTHTFSNNFTISSGKTLKPKDGAELKFPSGKYLYVNGTLTCDEATFTRTSGTWGGIKYQSGSTGTLDEATISNATYGVYCNSASPTIQYSDISNCTYGIYNYNCGFNTIKENTISSTYGIYNYDSSPRITDNEVISSNIGLYCDNSSSPELYTGDNYFHSSYVNFGVWADDVSNPHLGDASCSVNGNNSFVYTMYDVAVVHAGTYCDIPAENNWWGTSSPSAGMFSGDVDWDPYLSSMPSYSPQAPSPENDLFDQNFSFSSIAPDGSQTELISYYMEEWPLDLKIRFLRYLLNNNEVMGISALCMDIIKENPYAPEAFTALDIIYQITKKENIAKDIDKESMKTYLKTFKENKGNKMLNGSALLMLAGLERAEGIPRIDKIYKEHKDSYVAKYALYQKFMYYFHDAEDMKKAEEVLALLDSEYPDDRVTFEAHLLMGDNEVDAKTFYTEYSNKETPNVDYVTTDIQEILPEEYELKTAYPNPFNPSTTLEYALPIQSKVECGIYDVSGNLVREYSFNQSAGTYSIIWDGSDVSSGIYLIRFTAEASDGSETFVDYQKVTLLK